MTRIDSRNQTRNRTSVLRLAHAGLAAAALLGAVALAQAQTPAAGIGYTTVAQARAALEARDGQDVTVTHADGWTHVQDPAGAAQWSFTPPGHAAHPAAVRRVIRRSPSGEVAVDIDLLCEAPAEACTGLRAEFEQFSERIRQSVKARGRQGSSTRQP